MNITIWFGFVLLILLMKFYWPPIKNNNKKKTNGFQLDQPRREGSRLPMHPTDDAPASALGQWVEIQEGGRCSIPTPSTEIQQPVSSYSHSPFPWPHNFGIAALLWKYLHACFFFTTNNFSINSLDYWSIFHFDSLYSCSVFKHYLRKIISSPRAN